MTNTDYGFVRASTAAVIMKDGKVLLGRRNKPTAHGKWVLPGGAMNLFEPMKDALRREIKEETGLEIDVKDFIGVYEIIAPEVNIHKIISYYFAEHVSGELVSTDELSETRFFTSEEVREIIKNGQTTPTITKVLRDVKFV